jgi:hydrogenase maturation protease
MPELVVLAAGNPARGDDALGPLLLARLEQLARPGVGVVLDFQFQVEHALDLDGAAAALFIDAHCRQAEAARLVPLEPAARAGAASHALTPGEVLAVRRQIGRAVPPAWLLSLRGTRFALGEGLSRDGEASLAAGWACLEAFLGARGLG